MAPSDGVLSTRAGGSPPAPGAACALPPGTGRTSAVGLAGNVALAIPRNVAADNMADTLAIQG
jgi:hypothetical protein